MTKICIDRENTNAWFEMEGGGQVLLQVLNPDDIDDINRQTIEKKTEFKLIDGKPQVFQYEAEDKELQNELFCDRIIIDWKDLYDSKGDAIECTKNNKMLLMTRSKMFSDLVLGGLKELQELERQRIEEAEKNSLTG